MQRIFWVALLILGALIAALLVPAYVLTHYFSAYVNAANVVAAIASILAVFVTATQLIRGVAASSFRKRTRLLSFSLFSALRICAAIFFVEACFSLAKVISSGAFLSSRDFIVDRIFLPYLVTALFLVLDYKVSAHRSLDLQKVDLTELTRTLIEWPMHLHDLTPAAVKSQETKERYLNLLEALCKRALHVASAAGHQRQKKSLDGLTAVLFLANVREKNFVSVAVAGGGTHYRKAIESFHPPFFKLAEFRNHYNRIVDKVKAEKPRDMVALLREFREISKDCISTSGLTYAIERKLSFDDSYAKCIAFRYEFLHDIPDDERSNYQFRQVVGIPVAIFGKKVGVLLLMASKGHRLYTKDKIYRLIGNVFGCAVQFGIIYDLFVDRGLVDIFGSAPSLKKEEELEGLIELINGLSSGFSERC